MARPSAPAEHPAPHRAAVGLAPLLYGLLAAPIAWFVGQIAGSSVGQRACFPGTEPLAAPTFHGVLPATAAILAVCLAVCLSAAVVAMQAWRRTRKESEGDQHTLLAAGEGRTRFMAFAGLLTSLGFALATLFAAPAVVFVPAC